MLLRYLDNAKRHQRQALVWHRQETKQNKKLSKPFSVKLFLTSLLLVIAIPKWTILFSQNFLVHWLLTINIFNRAITLSYRTRLRKLEPVLSVEILYDLLCWRNNYLTLLTSCLYRAILYLLVPEFPSSLLITLEFPSSQIHFLRDFSSAFFYLYPSQGQYN